MASNLVAMTSILVIFIQVVWHWDLHMLEGECESPADQDEPLARWSLRSPVVPNGRPRPLPFQHQQSSCIKVFLPAYSTVARLPG